MGNAREFTAGFLFCGLGAGALGFLDASARLGHHAGRFTNLGGIDNSEDACLDFERLTGGRATRADLATMQPAELRAAWGDEAPDCVFLSPPCKGFSRLLGKAAAATEKYQALNRLVLQGINLMLSTWDRGPDGRGLPAAIVLENVPGIRSRGEKLLGQIRALLEREGYRFHEGFHDCGEIGGLAQHRRRYLLVARLPARIPDYIYQPTKRRVRGCGEVIGELLLPEHPDAGPLHRLPRISWLNWCRLAMIPPGGDWRDLPSAFETQAGNPNAHRNKHRVVGWEDPSGAVTGATRPGSGGPSVSDPRLGYQPRRGAYEVQPMEEPARTVRGRADIRTGPAAIADTRLSHEPWPSVGAFKVQPWDEPSRAVRGASSIRTGPSAVADPRLQSPLAEGQKRREVIGRHKVADWQKPIGVVTGSGSNAVANVADPRVAITCTPRSGAYGVLGWEDPAGAVTGAHKIDNRPAAIADERVDVAADRPVPEHYGALDLERALGLVDGRLAPKERVPVIVSPTSGAWHRPLTTLELAALQGIPTDGLVLAGASVTRWRERIGNAVPVQAATAIAESVLTALLAGATGWFLAHTGQNVWVRRRADDSIAESYEVRADG